MSVYERVLLKHIPGTGLAGLRFHMIRGCSDHNMSYVNEDFSKQVPFLCVHFGTYALFA